MHDAPQDYVVGLSSDIAAPDGSTIFGDVGLERLTAAGLRWEVMPPLAGDSPTPEEIAPYDAILSFGHWSFSRELVAASPRLKHVARHGAGHDGIDLDGLAAEGVTVTNAPDGVRRPLALAALTLLLALSHKLVQNQRLATDGRWDARGEERGLGVTGRTIGIIGLGQVGADLACLVAPLGVTLIALDRPSARQRAAELGVELVSLEELAARSDYVVVTASLTPSSRHTVDAAFLALMRPESYIINVARGPLVDQAALTLALQEGRIAGAGLDVLDVEPPASDEPLLHMDNVIVTPHSLCWTAEFVRDVSTSVMESLVDVARGRHPQHALNQPVARRPTAHVPPRTPGDPA
ncbi:NAD(P)-dependent oxidoreductase [Sanguibacter sp. 25GB23B1]|uniref:NAD(P)-dependent oxidoreductase n=1 Tax=unclassified Sanguibacter TaxID=2645534 RepID=UPI0032AF44AB